MTNWDVLKKAVDERDTKMLGKIAEKIETKTLGVCEHQCPYYERCNSIPGYSCELDDDEELKIWLDLESKF